MGEPGSFGVYWRLLGAQVRSHTAYRASFAIDAVTNGLVPLIDVITIAALFRVTRTLGGFDAGEVLLMFGLSVTAFSLADLAVGNIERIPQYIRTGMLDAVLVRPLSVLGQLLTTDFTIRRATRVVVSAAILSLALSKVDIAWTPARALFLPVVVLAGAVLFSAVFVATATVAFWWTESSEFANGLTYGGRDFSAYPVTVYNGLFRRIFGYTLGFAAVAYYPALVLLGRPDPLGLPDWLAVAMPAIALPACAVAALIWRTGVRQYRSTGS